LSLEAIRAGLKDNLERDGVLVSPYVLSNPTLPVIWIRPSPTEGIEYHQAMGNGVENWTMLVQAYVGIPTDIAAQKTLDEMISSTGTNSVKAAIESDKTLGGAAHDLIVKKCSGYLEYQRTDGSVALGAEWEVLVLAAG
jgi:hypothetical protein